MNNKELRSDTTTATILEAAIDGITETYLLDSRIGREDNFDNSQIHLQSLVKQGLLVELADKDRKFIAYRTTPQGLEHLMMTKSLRNSLSSQVVVEA